MCRKNGIYSFSSSFSRQEETHLEGGLLENGGEDYVVVVDESVRLLLLLLLAVEVLVVFSSCLEMNFVILLVCYYEATHVSD